jgi:hypothetical protein
MEGNAERTLGIWCSATLCLSITFNRTSLAPANALSHILLVVPGLLRSLSLLTLVATVLLILLGLVATVLLALLALVATVLLILLGLVAAVLLVLLGLVATVRLALLALVATVLLVLLILVLRGGHDRLHWVRGSEAA